MGSMLPYIAAPWILWDWLTLNPPPLSPLSGDRRHPEIKRLNGVAHVEEQSQQILFHGLARAPVPVLPGPFGGRTSSAETAASKWHEIRNGKILFSPNDIDEKLCQHDGT